MNQPDAGENQDPKEEKKSNASVQLLVFVFAFIAILTFLFYMMGLYDIK
ncbi:MAG TPA: hypothetical protein VIU33_03265 [Nitrospiria bacterium]